MVLPLDLSDLNSLPDRINQALKVFDHIDIIVHNGGISCRGDILSTKMDVAIKVMMVNYFGQMAVTKGKFMKESFIFYFVNMCSSYLHGV
jgi:dehydrogenase/reductase SDR family protein 7B